MKKVLVMTLVALFIVTISCTIFAEKPEQGGTFVFGSTGDAEVINPVISNTSTATDYESMVYESLIKINRSNMKPMAGPLTVSYKSSKDNLTWTFKLKKGINFSDGHELTTDDVKFTFDIMADPDTNTSLASQVEPIDKIEIIDDYTIAFKLKYPYPNFLTSTMTTGIIPAHIFRGTDINTNPANHQPVGTGPFILKEWNHNDHATFVAREDYHRGRVYLDKVIYKIVANQNALLAACESGDIDGAGIPKSEVERLQKVAPEKGLKVLSRWYFGYSYIGFNLQKDMFKDLRVRKALAISIYKPAIAEVAFFGQGKPATSTVPPGVKWAYNSNIPKYEYDIEQAKKLLTEAGWVDRDGDGIREKDGKELSFTIITNKGAVAREKVALLAQKFWKQIGVNCEVSFLNWSTFLTGKVLKKDFDAMVLGWSGRGPNPDDYPLFHSSQIDEGYNFVSYSNETVDKLLFEARTIMDLERRKEIYHKVQRIIHDDYPYVFLVYPKANAVFDEKVRGLNSNPLDRNFVADWKDIWIAN